VVSSGCESATPLRRVQIAGGHPHIPDLKSTTSERGTDVAVVELVEGKILNTVDRPLSPERAREAAMNLADALAVLSGTGVPLATITPAR
jgi:hypothetical protein